MSQAPEVARAGCAPSAQAGDAHCRFLNMVSTPMPMLLAPQRWLMLERLGCRCGQYYGFPSRAILHGRTALHCAIRLRAAYFCH